MKRFRSRFQQVNIYPWSRDGLSVRFMIQRPSPPIILLEVQQLLRPEASTLLEPILQLPWVRRHWALHCQRSLAMIGWAKSPVSLSPFSGTVRLVFVKSSVFMLTCIIRTGWILSGTWPTAQTLTAGQISTLVSYTTYRSQSSLVSFQKRTWSQCNLWLTSGLLMALFQQTPLMGLVLSCLHNRSWYWIIAHWKFGGMTGCSQYSA